MRDDDAMTDSPLDRLAASIDALDALHDDNASLAMRDFMITHLSLAYANRADLDIRALSADYDISPHDLLPICRDILALSRDAISDLALSYSLCPFHMIDYAICFDDDDDECAAIRDCFPSHDT